MIGDMTKKIMTKKKAKWLLGSLIATVYVFVFWVIPLAHNPDVSYWGMVGGLHACVGVVVAAILAFNAFTWLWCFIENN